MGVWSQGENCSPAQGQLARREAEGKSTASLLLPGPQPEDRGHLRCAVFQEQHLPGRRVGRATQEYPTHLSHPRGAVTLHDSDWCFCCQKPHFLANAALSDPALYSWTPYNIMQYLNYFSLTPYFFCLKVAGSAGQSKC